ncbi:MAG: hypothetical protein L6308_06580 [Candidatus Omnitrophica bacterium]|nr:hypothetical protein [Candidatus Omnitrophota bacterium]
MYLRVQKAILAIFIVSSIISPVFAKEAQNPNSEEVKYSPKNLQDKDAMQAEMDFYAGNDHEAELIFTGLRAKKDHDIALWNNQLGSLYLTQGKVKEAKDAFMEAYLLMNDITAFKDLELHSVGLVSSEMTKGYKGDPYEKVFNSFYVGMLLYADNDLENALAAFKNGILCDSDVTGKLYKSDVALMYLMATRVELMQKNQSMADDFFKQATEAFYLSHPDNRLLVSQKQGLLDDLDKKQKELQEKEAKENIKLEKVINALKSEIGKLETDIKLAGDNIEDNNRKISIDSLKEFIDSNDNTLICIETGRGPLKYQTGTYGEKAVFTLKPYPAVGFSIVIDNFTQIKAGSFLKNNDLFYQASTRGGRVMDGLLKGKAEFKKTTQDISNVLSTASQIYDPYGVFAMLSFASGAVSSATNPYADARHWSLLPAELQIISLRLATGTHQLQINAYDSTGKTIESSKINVQISNSSNNVIFKRFRGVES